MNDEAIFALERPHKNLLWLYLIRCLLSGPFVFLTLPMLFFRYMTLRYSFDEQGVSMRWGILFRREINVAYARIQDIHLASGILQRWLGLANLQVQTASGSAAAEITIEGLKEHEAVRDFLYARMRGSDSAPPRANTHNAPSGEAVEILQEIAADVRAVRVALEARDV
jgi:putative membrane protein